MGLRGVPETRVKRFRVDGPLEAGATIRLDPPASHHLLTVCRHPRGGALVAFDGTGLEADAVLVDGADGVATIRVTAVRASAPSPALHLVLALPKGPALEHALRMAVEVGATHVHPVTTERTLPKGDHPDRWGRVLEGAAEQCRRSSVPVLSAVMPLRRAIEAIPPDTDRRVAVPGADDGARATGDAALAIGPEGGFSPTELDFLLRSDWTPIGLGPWVLRVDTAVAVGLSALAARR